MMIMKLIALELARCSRTQMQNWLEDYHIAMAAAAGNVFIKNKFLLSIFNSKESVDTLNPVCSCFSKFAIVKYCHIMFTFNVVGTRPS